MRLSEKADEIEQYVNELGSILPSDFENYQRDIKTKAACERYFEKVKNPNHSKLRGITGFLTPKNGYALPHQAAEYKTHFFGIIEALIDLAFLVLKEQNLELPEDDKTVFSILVQENIIDDALAVRLKEAKGMRNILAHKYGCVDDEIVFDAIVNELEKDAIEFIQIVREYSNT